MHWFFFFKQKTAYSLRISYWSSDVCSSDLQIGRRRGQERIARGAGIGGGEPRHRRRRQRVRQLQDTFTFGKRCREKAAIDQSRQRFLDLGNQSHAPVLELRLVGVELRGVRPEDRKSGV